MELPLVAPAPIVAEHAHAFADLFDNKRQFLNFQHYLTGLIVLPNTSMSNIARCILDCSDKTNLSRFLATAPWVESAVNDRRITYLLQQTKPHRATRGASALVIDDTLAEHTGSLFDHIARHYDHGDGTYPLAHNPVTSFYVSGPVRFPIELRLYRRYDELTQWESVVAKRFPDLVIPTTAKERTKLRTKLEPQLLADPDFRALHKQFRTKIDLAIDLVQSAIAKKIPFGVVLFDSWYLAEPLIRELTRRHKDWISVLKANRNIETNSFMLRDASGAPIRLPTPHVKISDLLPLIPPSAYRAVQVGDETFWCFTLVVRIPGLGKVRIVISHEREDLSGRSAVLITNRVDWTAKQIIERYLKRWPTETFYQDCKEQLGFDRYQMRSAAAIGKHWCLVFVAYSLLHLSCLPPVPRKKARLIQTIGAACRQQGRAMIQQLILLVHRELCQGAPADAVFERIFAKQQPPLAGSPG